MKKRGNLIKDIIYLVVGLLAISIILAIWAFAWPFLLASIPLYLKFSKQEDARKKRNTAIGIGFAAILSLILFIFAGSGDSQTIEPESSSSAVDLARSFSLPETVTAETESETLENATTVTETQFFQETEPNSAAPEESSRDAAESDVQQLAEKIVQEESRRVAEVTEAQTAQEVETQQIMPEEPIKTAEQTSPIQTQATVVVPDNNSTMVWIDDTAKKYHKKNGCGMDNAYQVTLEEAIERGKNPCGRCYW